MSTRTESMLATIERLSVRVGMFEQQMAIISFAVGSKLSDWENITQCAKDLRSAGQRRLVRELELQGDLGRAKVRIEELEAERDAALARAEKAEAGRAPAATQAKDDADIPF